MISIIDYGAGNLRSVQNTLDELGVEYSLVRNPRELLSSTSIVLPGVGHFGQMIRTLDQMGLRAPLITRMGDGIPFLGICLGLQALFQSSEEAPDLKGLGVFQGTIRRFDTTARVPHMGWNSIEPRAGARLLRNLGPQPYLYFAHSYYAPVNSATAATCNYTLPYTAILESENIFGVQFHPEKSGPLGLRIVRNFVELCH